MFRESPFLTLAASSGSRLISQQMITTYYLAVTWRLRSLLRLDSWQVGAKKPPSWIAFMTHEIKIHWKKWEKLRYQIINLILNEVKNELCNWMILNDS